MANDRQPRVYLLAPGSGGCGKALEASRSYETHIAVGKEYDVAGRRYPPGWSTMHGVALDEAAAATSGIDSLQIGFGRASPKNLATWASELYDPASRQLACVDLSLKSYSGEGGGTALEQDVSAFEQRQAEDSFACLVAGSRGGQVTLPALWLLGVRLPAVVLNGACCRADVSWTWPAHVPVVLLTGGHDFFNQHLTAPGLWDLESDAAYRRELWSAVPAANRATTAILHLPRMAHAFEASALEALLPQAMRYAASGLAPAARPDGRGLPIGEACVLVTADSAPEGELLCGELVDTPPLLPPPPPPPRLSTALVGCVQRCLPAPPCAERARPALV